MARIEYHRFSLFRSALTVALTSFVYRAVEDAPAAQAAPVAPLPVEAAQDASDEAPATVSIDVPAQHQSLLERATALLSKDIGWVKDNIEAGLTHLENMFKDDEAKS
jgi:hypothetical protein